MEKKRPRVLAGQRLGVRLSGEPGVEPGLQVVPAARVNAKGAIVFALAIADLEVDPGRIGLVSRLTRVWEGREVDAEVRVERHGHARIKGRLRVTGRALEQPARERVLAFPSVEKDDARCKGNERANKGFVGLVISVVPKEQEPFESDALGNGVLVAKALDDGPERESLPSSDPAELREKGTGHGSNVWMHETPRLATSGDFACME